PPPTPGSIGADRDITYLLVLDNGHRIDVPASLVEPHYQRSLHETLNSRAAGGSYAAPSPDELREFARGMDHSVTDGFVLEAYRPGTEDVGIFLSDPSVRLGAAGAQDVASTIRYKGVEWFDDAAAHFNVG